MAIYNSIKDFKPLKNEKFLAIAESLKPELYVENVVAVPSATKPMGKGDKVLLDFNNHHVGELCFRIESVGSPMDAPAKLRIRYIERPFELEEDWDNYHGEVSSSWLQEEIIFFDELPVDYVNNRRHAFRYVEIMVIDTTPKYQVILSNIYCKSCSSASYNNVEKVNISDPELAIIDKVSLRTLHQCSQLVFEDGVKRDRRLWLGDFHLQALATYETFKNYDLVKRCLYLFAGMTMQDGQTGACLFHSPRVQVDDTLLFDFSLHYVLTLCEYYEATKDIETLKELYPTAKTQVDLALKQLDENGVVKDGKGWWCFIDWGAGLNKQAGAHATLILALKFLVKIMNYLGKDSSYYEEESDKAIKVALDHLYDKEKGLFVSGKDKQISWASQVWFALTGIFDKENTRKLLGRIEKEKSAIKMTTPYAHHYYVMALLQCDQKEKAIKVIKSYWGGMIKDGADTFYEVYDPSNPHSSPYGGRLINSYCHAWSGTPSYIIRKYLLK